MRTSSPVPSLDRPPLPDMLRPLRQIVDTMPAPLFVTLDGGRFDDLPGRLARDGMPCRSLFRDPAGADLQRAGPWLVAVRDARGHDIVARLDATVPCAVYWSCPDGEAVLWRHLRTLNEVLVPREDRARGHERVLFRHWDPAALGALLPLLTKPQLARVIGPAAGLAFAAPDHGGVKYAKDLAGRLPPRVRGPLRLDPEQMERLRQAMRHASRLRIARFLKAHPPPASSGIDDAFAWTATLASEPTADELGLITERGRARWAYVMMMSDGRAASAPEVRAFLLDGGDTPDNRVKALIAHTVAALRGQGAPS